jgi:glutamate/tyrosine decarboxylase-like PLP-dependent enzyme
MPSVRWWAMPASDPKTLPGEYNAETDIDRQDHAYLAPLFLGPSGENGSLVEEIFTGSLRDHVYWRRNFHPEDLPTIPAAMHHRDDFIAATARLEQALFKLSADLKKSVPSFAPRYIGHMVSDPLLPALLGQLITTLYNPNNIAGDAAPVTLDLELDVGRQLAALLGMEPHAATGPRAWGHITSGGTVANHEALWLLRAARLYPPALAAGLRRAADRIPGLSMRAPLPGRPLLTELGDWALMNFTIRQACDLHAEFIALVADLDADVRRLVLLCVSEERHDHLGPEFFQRLGMPVPIVIAPATAHYSWNKAMTVLGIGRSHLRLVPTDAHMRMDAGALEEALERALAEHIPVLAVIGVLGTTEFGTIDPLHKIVVLRKRFAEKGLGFAFHVDAAWGGYLSTLFRRPDGGFVPRREVRRQFRYFPTPPVYQAFRALANADTVTVDPHKLGYVAYGAGALVARDHRLTGFVGERPPYMYDHADAAAKDDNGIGRLKELGDYILEGSKPGAAAAAVWLTHTVVPLNCEHFGRLCRQTIRANEYLYDRLQKLAHGLAPVCKLTVPVEPDTNLICLVLNPAGNACLAVANDLGRRIYGHMSIDSSQPVQTRQFIGSYTSIRRASLSDRAALDLVARIGVEPDSFVATVADPKIEADHVFLVRHTLMNPWLRVMQEGKNYIDRYCDFLASVIETEVGSRC